MELAEYYGGAYSGGMVKGSPAMRRKMAHLRSMRGGVKRPQPASYYQCVKNCRATTGYAPTEAKLRQLANLRAFAESRRKPRMTAEEKAISRANAAIKRRATIAARERTGCNIDGQMLSFPQLKAQAKLLGIKGYSKLKRDDLCALLSGNLPMF